MYSDRIAPAANTTKRPHLSALALSIVIWAAASPLHAKEFSAYISRDTAQLGVVLDTGAVGGPGGADFSAAAFYNDSSDWLFSLGLKASGRPAGNQPMVFGVGAKAYLGMIDKPDSNFQSLALGGDVRHVIPANMPVSLGLEGYYAPRVTSFSDGRELLDLGARIEVEVTPGAAGFLGYRYIQADLNQKKRYRMDDNVHFGVRLDF